MTKKIESLTPEQEARFPEFVDRWLKIGLCTDPVDRPKAEAAIRLCYIKTNLKPPDEIVWCLSPNAMIQEVRNRLGQTINQWDCVYGQHEAAWLSFYSYFRDVCGLVQETEPLEGLFALAETCGWIAPFEGICFASEKHNVCKLDERQRTHCADGPAIAFPNGDSIYVYHGVEVPSWVIEEKHRITPETIDAEENSEVKRVMVELYGIDKYILDSGAEPVQHDRFGELYAKEVGGRPVKIIKLIDSTPMPDGVSKTYFKIVPPEMETAHEAVAWMHGMTVAEYDPDVET
jgi:hypothetical protein